MPTQTTEHAFESYVEEILLNRSGWRRGSREEFVADLMMQRMADNDRIVTRYMDDQEFGNAAFEVLSKAIYEAIPLVEEGAAATQNIS